MKSEMVDWVIEVLKDVENILTSNKLLATAEALQDTQIVLLNELNKQRNPSIKNDKIRETPTQINF